MPLVHFDLKGDKEGSKHHKIEKNSNTIITRKIHKVDISRCDRFRNITLVAELLISLSEARSPKNLKIK